MFIQFILSYDDDEEDVCPVDGGGTAAKGCGSDEEAEAMTTETTTTVCFEFREEPESEDMLMSTNDMTPTETPSKFTGTQPDIMIPSPECSCVC